MRLFKIILYILFIFLSLSTQAQKDTIVLKNGDELIGRLKEMEKGVAAFKTDYSDSDFKVKWKEVRAITTQSSYLIFVNPDKRYNGRLLHTGANNISLIHDNDTLHTVALQDIVYLREVKSDILSKLSGELGIGLNLAKAQHLVEFNIRSRVSYRAEHWNASAQYDGIRSTRSGAERVERTDASLDYQYILKHNWFTVSKVSLYSNSEQSIKLRTLAQGGMGKLIIMNPKLYWGFQAGITYNNESFRTAAEKDFNNSSEVFLGTEFNIYDVKDFSLLTKASAFPSLTESERLRLDFSIDLKYDLPLDFFVKFSYTFNHDNKPVMNAESTDYIFQTTIGWDFN